MTGDEDPTGMSRLLAGLKESGPMPDDLSDRIRASLGEEQSARAGPDTTRSDEEPEEGTFWPGAQDGGRGPTRRTHAPGRWVLGIAAAAALALGVGGIVVLGDDSGRQTASESGASSPPDMDESSAAGTEEPGDPSSSTSSGTPSQVPAFAITQTDTAYTRESLPGKAARLEADPRSAPELSDPSVVDGMGTAAGASDCLTRLGHPELQPVVIDVARFEGQPGLLLIAEEMPEGAVRAWAITTGCEPIWDRPFPVPQT